ncbi:MAG: phosphoribosylformylglycinamidine synthase subunit PurQ [Leptospirales bacterium]|nr:phosphoribosylformylglycinamidine synthase subunit PurQ [Leptospirales bacterium]
MKAGVLTFPGSNCDQDILRGLKLAFDLEADLLWHADAIERRYDLLIVPGGFSYGDYLRCGAIARFARAMDSLREHRRSGRPVVGICNGFQILCEAGLLPGALIRNVTLKHICKTVALKANPHNAFARGLQANREYRIPVSHGEGNFRIDEEELRSLFDHDQIAFQYADNVNGSAEQIAGITDREHLCLGLMPHPERAVDPLTSSSLDGLLLLQSFLERCQLAVA